MHLTEIDSKTAESFTFLYGEQECAYTDVPATGQKIMDGLQDFVQQAFVEITGDAVWAYAPAGEQRLKLQAGFPVKNGAKTAHPFLVKEEPEWKCLSAIYKGSMEHITEAWDEMWKEVAARGLSATAESREIYRVWVDFDAADNVTELQVKLK
jgi:effector-binding domain-containing protein